MEELGLEPRIYACKAYVIASLTKPPNYIENICIQKCIITQNITKYLNALLLHISCGGLDSNQRPSAYEADELPTALPRDIRAGSQIRTDVSLRIMITSQAESTTVPFRQLLNQKNIEDSFLVNKTFLVFRVYHFAKFPYSEIVGIEPTYYR